MRLGSRGRNSEVTPPLIVMMSLQVVIAWWVALEQLWKGKRSPRFDQGIKYGLIPTIAGFWSSQSDRIYDSDSCFSSSDCHHDVLDHWHICYCVLIPNDRALSGEASKARSESGRWQHLERLFLEETELSSQYCVQIVPFLGVIAAI